MERRSDSLDLPKTHFAVAYSGGGDSAALLHILRGRNPLVLIVDHALRAGSDIEAQTSARYAESLGLETRVLTWEHPPISTGLQAKARAARYALLGEACRQEGITDLLTGHTEDDQAETVLMRMDAGTGWRGAAGMASRQYAPIWPALAGVTLWRPLLGVSRARLRNYLRAHHVPFIDDPSNADPHFTRIRARERLSGDPDLRADMLAIARDMQAGRAAERAHFRTLMKTHMRCEYGAITVNRIVPKALLSLCIQAVGGTGAPIAVQKLAVIRDSQSAQTLTGAQIIPSATTLRIIRNPGAIKPRAGRAMIAAVRISDHSTLWDGRWWVDSDVASQDATVHAMALSPTPLSKALKAKIRSHVPADLRPTWPIIVKDGAILGWAEDGAFGSEILRSAVLPRLLNTVSGKLP